MPRFHQAPEGLEIDLRGKIGQNGSYSGVGRQSLKSLVCYSSEGHNLLLNTRNNSGGLAIARHKFRDRMEQIHTVVKLFPSTTILGGSVSRSQVARMLVVSHSGTRMSIGTVVSRSQVALQIVPIDL